MLSKGKEGLLAEQDCSPRSRPSTLLRPLLNAPMEPGPGGAQRSLTGIASEM